MLFPFFRSRFISEAAWAKDTEDNVAQSTEDSSTDQPLVRMAGCGPAAVRGPSNFIRPLMLDLNTLPREDGPPSESVLKRQKFAVFEKHCSQVADGLFVSGEAVARDRSILQQHNISHVVNCVGALYPEYFKADGIQYKTLWLQDHPQEDITCVLYDTFDFIEAARKGSTSTGATSRQPQQQHSGGRVPPLALQQPPQQRFLQQQQSQQQQSVGRVLVHCSQGVSRSTTIAIAYLMWRTGGSYDEVYQAVRALRGVTSPNVGFMCQLMNWAKRRQRPPTRVRLYRITPHCADAPLYLVPKAVSPKPGCSHPDWTQLDPRGCFVAHLSNKVYVWRGQQCVHSMLEAGLQAAARLSRYEGAPAAQVVRQGEEPADLLAALAPAGSHGGSSTCQSSSCCTRAESAAASGEPSSNNLAGAAAAAAAAAAGGGQLPAAADDGAAAAAAGGGWPNRQQQQEEQGDGDIEMTPSSAAGSRPHSAGHEEQQQPVPVLEQREQQHEPSQAGLGPAQSGSSQQQAAGPSGAAAAAAAAQVLLGVQLGPAGSLGELQQVPEYDSDFELWVGALHKSSQSEGGRQTPRSPLAAISGAWEEGALAHSPKAGSPAALEGRDRKYSRSDSEGRAVVPSCRQPGRLSTSSSQAWPDSSTPGSAVNAAAAAPAGPVSISEGGGYVAVEAGQARVAAVEDWMPVEATPAAAEVEMRHSSTDDSL